MIRITKEQLYEIQNELIDELLDSGWSNNHEVSSKCLVCINGIRDTVSEIIDRCYDDDVEPVSVERDINYDICEKKDFND